MTSSEFDRLPVIDDPGAVEIQNIKTVSLFPGDLFLSQTLTDTQRGLKNKGDLVTVYKVYERKPNGNIVYGPVYIEIEN